MVSLGGRATRPGRKSHIYCDAPRRPRRFGRVRRPALALAALLACLVLCALARPAFAAAPQDPLGAAEKLFDKGQAAAAETLLLDILKREPSDERVWALLGRVRDGLGERAEALDAFRMALRLSPADTLTRMRLDMAGDLAPVAAAGRGRGEPAAKTPRPPSALERAALEELGRATADPEHVGCGGAASVVLDPLWTGIADGPRPPQSGQPPPSGLPPQPAQAPKPPQPALPDGDDALEFSGLIAARLFASGGVAVLTRHGPYPVRLAERAALAEMSGARIYLALAVTSLPGSLGQSGQSGQSGKAPSPGSQVSMEAFVLGPPATDTSASAAFAQGAVRDTDQIATQDAARLAALAGPNDPAGPLGPIGPIGPIGQLGPIGRIGLTGAMGLKPSAVDLMDAGIRRAALDKAAYALAGRILARCRADGLAGPARAPAPVTGQAALLSAIDRPTVLLAVTIAPGPEPGRRETLEKLAASLAASIVEEAGRCP